MSHLQILGIFPSSFPVFSRGEGVDLKEFDWDQNLWPSTLLNKNSKNRPTGSAQKSKENLPCS